MPRRIVLTRVPRESYDPPREPALSTHRSSIGPCSTAVTADRARRGEGPAPSDCGPRPASIPNSLELADGQIGEIIQDFIEKPLFAAGQALRLSFFNQLVDGLLDDPGHLGHESAHAISTSLVPQPCRLASRGRSAFPASLRPRLDSRTCHDSSSYVPTPERSRNNRALVLPALIVPRAPGPSVP